MQGPVRRTVMIRNLDADVWSVVRGEAASRRWDTAAVVEHIVREWMAGRQIHDASDASASVTDGSDDRAGIAVAS